MTVLGLRHWQRHVTGAWARSTHTFFTSSLLFFISVPPSDFRCPLTTEMVTSAATSGEPDDIFRPEKVPNVLFLEPRLFEIGYFAAFVHRWNGVHTYSRPRRQSTLRIALEHRTYAQPYIPNVRVGSCVLPNTDIVGRGCDFVKRKRIWRLEYKGDLQEVNPSRFKNPLFP